MENPNLNRNTVRTNIRFVRDIGTRVVSLCNDLGELEKRRDKIVADKSSGVQLQIDPVTGRIRVARTVWENDGFGIEELAERLAT